MNSENCIRCGKKRKLVKSVHEGVSMESYYCGNCKESLLTKEQALTFGKKYQQKLLKEEYVRKPIKIGHSYGMTFPKDIVNAFNLDSKKTKLKINSDVSKSKIEISVI